MKNIFIVGALVLSLGLVSCSDSTTPKENTNLRVEENRGEAIYSLSVDKSNIEWNGFLAGMYTHTGNVKFKSGSLKMYGNQVVGGEFVVDMKSISTTDGDELYHMGSRAELVAHLESEDFFDVANFETASLKILPNDTHRNLMVMTVALTIKGVTKELKLNDVEVYYDGPELVLVGELIFNRQLFGISFRNSNSEMVIGDQITLHFKVIANN